MDARQVTVLLTVGEMTPSWFIGEAGRVFTRAGSSPLQVMWRSLNEMLRVCHLLSFPLMAAYCESVGSWLSTFYLFLFKNTCTGS